MNFVNMIQQLLEQYDYNAVVQILVNMTGHSANLIRSILDAIV